MHVLKGIFIWFMPRPIINANDSVMKLDQRVRFVLYMMEYPRYVPIKVQVYKLSGGK